MMFRFIFILFNDYNYLSVDQHIFQNENFNSNEIRRVLLENVIFICFKIRPLAIFSRLTLFLQAFVIESF